jgi:Holliday junction DNA helicase RuvA
MIGSLRGVLVDRSARGEVLVEVGGVGYRVQVAAPTLAALGADLGGPVFLYVHTHVREDALVLYGFASADERQCFEALLAAHGVGPAVALAILSVHSPPALRRAVATDDADALTLVPGIGKKTAARLLLDLKSRLDVPDVDVDIAGIGIGGLGSVGPDGMVRGSPRAEVRAALVHLGYGPDEVRDILRELPDDGGTAVEDLLRVALRSLAVVR